jgi:hypothetical protein
LKVGEGQRGNRTVLQIWRMAPLCVMWCQWRERNARSSEDRELGLIELKKMVLQTLYSWRVMWHLSQASTLVEFLDLCTSFQLKSFCIHGLYCILFVYMGYAPLRFYMN